MIIDQLKNNDKLSPNEQSVAKYILDKIDVLEDLSIQQISSETYTSKATVVRLAKKLNFDGWTSLKDKLILENNYYHSDTNINPNIPFTSQDSLHAVVHNLSVLHNHVIDKTSELINYEDLSKIIGTLKSSQRIYVFAMANTAAIIHDFKYKMRFLMKEVIIVNNKDDFGFTFQMLTKQDCCIFVSYSGKSFYDMGIHHLILQCNCPTISITSYSNNPLTKVTSQHLYLSEIEDKEENIGHFVSNTSIHYLLDLLYACLFQNSFDESMSLRQSYVEHTDYKTISKDK